jgi:hypothetical protein
MRWTSLGWAVVLGCGPQVEPGAEGMGDVTSASAPTSSGVDPSATTTVPGTSVGTIADTGEASTVTDASSATGSIVDGEPCDLWAQDCPDGYKCTPWANDGGNAWNAWGCFPVVDDPNPTGAPCTAVESGTSGRDDCDARSMCLVSDAETLGGECIAFCLGSEAEPSCADACSQCFIPGSGVLDLCVPACDAIAQDCGDSQACYPVADTFACAPDLSDDAGSPGDTCEFVNVCDPGLYCANPRTVPGCTDAGCCAPLCDLDAPDCSALAGTVCTPWYADGEAPPCGSLGSVGACMLPA